MAKTTATIIGDTSRFHQGSEANYRAFRSLVSKQFQIIQDIPYTAFGTAPLSYEDFLAVLRASDWWEGVNRSDWLIVHGEGLTEAAAQWAFPYLYFGPLATQLGKTSALVNFSMFDVEPYADLVAQFAYLACRESETHRRLTDQGFRPELSFDCIVLSQTIQAHVPGDGSIAALRGRNAIPRDILGQHPDVVRYNACWVWSDPDAVSCATFADYAQRVRTAERVLTTSFHGIILAMLAGVPFSVLVHNNPKYAALADELEPPSQNLGREDWHAHISRLWPHLSARAERNCPPLAQEPTAA